MSSSEDDGVPLPFDPNNYSDPHELVDHIQRQDPPLNVGSNFSARFQLEGYFFDSGTMKAWARFVGSSMRMVLVTHRSWKNKRTGFSTFHLVCEMYGKPRARPDVDDDFPPTSSRVAKSRKCGCPFELVGREEGQDRWKLYVRCGMHNHDLFGNLHGHPFAGRLTPTQNEKLRRGSKLGLKPRNLLNSLREEFGCVTGIRQVYNSIAKMKREDAEGRNDIQQALHELKKKGYYAIARGSEDNEVKDIFLAHPESRHMLSLFPYVIVMDSTYKTNEYKMPLLEIVGITSTKKTFAIAFVFMAKETADHYTWAMTRLRHLCKERMPDVIVTDREKALINAIKEVFPESYHLLCMWHVMSKIEVRAKVTHSRVKEREFYRECYALFESKTEVSYNERLQSMKDKWGNRWELMDYLDETWLADYKKSLVRAWVDYHPHFGTRTTNNCESAHHKLKVILNTSIGGFNEVTKCIDDMINEQVAQIKGSLEASRWNVRKSVSSNSIFAPLIHKVTDECFKLLLHNYEQSRTRHNDGVCRDMYWRHSFGVPCMHEILEVGDGNGGAITLRQIHPFWKQVVYERVINEEEDAEHVEAINPKRLDLLEIKRRIEADDLTDDQVDFMSSWWRDMMDPSKTTLKSPSKVIPKGRPTGKRSLRRDDIGLERARKEQTGRVRGRGSGHGSSQYEEANIPNEETNIPNDEVETSNRGRGRGRGRGSFRLEEVDLFHLLDDQVDLFVPYFVHKVEEVQGDGHCGYRTIAKLLGYGEKQYMRVRREIANELRMHKEVYTRAFLSGMDAFIDNVDFKSSRPCLDKPEKWMEAPMVPLAAATLYNKVVVVLSKAAPHTCLPMITTITNQEPPVEVIALVWINGNHWIPVQLDLGSPLPPLAPEWVHFHDPSVEGLQHLFEERINEWRVRKYEVDQGAWENFGWGY